MTLEERAEEIAELNKGRTQGQWQKYRYYILDDKEKSIATVNSHNEESIGNWDFIHAAPEMAQLIADQAQALKAANERAEELEEDVMGAYVEGYSKAKGIYINGLGVGVTCREHWLKSKAKQALTT